MVVLLIFSIFYREVWQKRNFLKKIWQLRRKSPKKRISGTLSGKTDNVDGFNRFPVQNYMEIDSQQIIIGVFSAPEKRFCMNNAIFRRHFAFVAFKWLLACKIWKNECCDAKRLQLFWRKKEIETCLIAVFGRKMVFLGEKRKKSGQSPTLNDFSRNKSWPPHKNQIYHVVGDLKSYQNDKKLLVKNICAQKLHMSETSEAFFSMGDPPRSKIWNVQSIGLVEIYIPWKFRFKILNPRWDTAPQSLAILKIFKFLTPLNSPGSGDRGKMTAVL